MRQFQEEDFRTTRQSVSAALMMLSFGVAVLGFLVAIDHPEWFHLRPVSGTAIAMSNAAERPVTDDVAIKAR